MPKLWSLQTLVSIFVVNFGLFFQSTCVLLMQCLSLPVYHFGQRSVYLQYIAYSMKLWSQSLIAVVQFFAPASLVITFDDSCLHSYDRSDYKDKIVMPIESLIQRNSKGDITKLTLPDRIIVTSNHQIYADWVYIWCVAHLAKAHGAVKIILKDSLKHLPVYGLGMQFFDFIFLKRKLASDHQTIVSNLERSKKDGVPLWLVLFPEGTVLSDCTRKRSKDYAEKNNLKDPRYTLLPRAAGLRLCMQTLGNSVEWVYDFTVGYPGIQAGQNPEDIYTIPGIFFFNKQPQRIHVYIRRFHVRDIPIKDDAAFSQWVYQRWAEKDDMMAYFYREGQFPASDHHLIRDLNVASSTTSSEQPATSNTVTVPIKLSNPAWKLLQPAICASPYLPLIFGIWYLGKSVMSLFFQMLPL